MRCSLPSEKLATANPAHKASVLLAHRRCCFHLLPHRSSVSDVPARPVKVQHSGIIPRRSGVVRDVLCHHRSRADGHIVSDYHILYQAAGRTDIDIIPDPRRLTSFDPMVVHWLRLQLLPITAVSLQTIGPP